MQKVCINCSSPFAITQEDKAFYQKLDVGPPSHCPDCRYQKRLAFRNLRKLYKRKCNGTGKPIIGVYHPNSPFTVYDQEYWMSDSWDALEYGRDFDFQRTFFDQFKGLYNIVPRWSRIVINSENSDYCVNCAGAKNCYLTTSSNDCEDCMYSMRLWDCRDCIDCLHVKQSELCYECLDSENLYECFYTQRSKNSQNLWFCFDVIGCSNCFLCSGLRNKQYSILNKQYSKDEYEKRVEVLRKKPIDELFRYLNSLKSQMQNHSEYHFNSENVTGDYIINSKNVFESYLAVDSEESKYIQDGKTVKNCYDCTNPDECIDSIEVGSSIWGNKLCFSENIGGGTECYYCSSSLNIENCFGCVGLKRKKYCILNKQYSKDEYEKLVPQIIEHMKKTKEWGEFFPIHLSPFSYHETEAQEVFPLSKEIALRNHYNWDEYLEEKPQVEKIIPGEKLPQNISSIPDDILHWAIECKETKRPFRIIQKELEFYRKYQLSLPVKHPDLRYSQRLHRRIDKGVCCSSKDDIQLLR